MADVTVRACQCPDCQAGHDHRDRQLHHQINLVMSRLNEQQRRWLAALEVQQAWRQRGVEIAATALVRVGPHATLEIGRGTTIGPYSILDLLDDPLAEAPSASRLVIGQRVAINEFNNIRASGGGAIVPQAGCVTSSPRTTKTWP